MSGNVVRSRCRLLLQVVTFLPTVACNCLDMRARLRARVGGWDQLSIDVLELLGVIVAAWVKCPSRSRAHRVLQL